jgi:hypothetical protein
LAMQVRITHACHQRSSQPNTRQCVIR